MRINAQLFQPSFLSRSPAFSHKYVVTCFHPVQPPRNARVVVGNPTPRHMAKRGEQNHKSDLKIEVDHVDAPDANDRLRKALEMILRRAAAEKESSRNGKRE